MVLEPYPGLLEGVLVDVFPPPGSRDVRVRPDRLARIHEPFGPLPRHIQFRLLHHRDSDPEPFHQGLDRLEVQVEEESPFPLVDAFEVILVEAEPPRVLVGVGELLPVFFPPRERVVDLHDGDGHELLRLIDGNAQPDGSLGC